MDNHTALVVGSSDRSQEKHPGSVPIAQTKENPSMFFFSDFLCFFELPAEMCWDDYGCTFENLLVPRKCDEL